MIRDVAEFADNQVWRSLGFELAAWDEGRADLAWDAPRSCCLDVQGGPIVRGGLVSALLDAAMGAACWSVLDAGVSFVTADLRVEFVHPVRPGRLVAAGRIGKRKRDVLQCTGELTGPDGVVCVTARATQVPVPADDSGWPDAAGGTDGRSPGIVRG